MINGLQPNLKIWVKPIIKRILEIRKKNSLASTKVDLERISKIEKSFLEISHQPDRTTTTWIHLKWILCNQVKMLKLEIMLLTIVLWVSNRLEQCQNLILRLNWWTLKKTKFCHRSKFQLTQTARRRHKMVTEKWRLTLALTIFLDWKPII